MHEFQSGQESSDLCMYKSAPRIIKYAFTAFVPSMGILGIISRPVLSCTSHGEPAAFDQLFKMLTPFRIITWRASSFSKCWSQCLFPFLNCIETSCWQVLPCKFEILKCPQVDTCQHFIGPRCLD